jgi:hypothetical protein
VVEMNDVKEPAVVENYVVKELARGKKHAEEQVEQAVVEAELELKLAIKFNDYLN